MIIHLIDGTYELFRHFYGIRRFKKTDPPFGAVTGVLHTVAKMIEDGGAQFHPLEDALVAMGVVVWPMIEFEADDALAAAAYLAAKDTCVEKVCIWTPDKDLAQCVVGDRVVQIDRRKNEIRDAEGVRAKFGVPPEFIPDYLALVGDAADGYPGIKGLGPRTAASLIGRFGRIEDFPSEILDSQRELALLFKDLATLRTDLPLFKGIDEIRWRGPASSFAAVAEKIGEIRLATRIRNLSAKVP